MAILVENSCAVRIHVGAYPSFSCVQNSEDAMAHSKCILTSDTVQAKDSSPTTPIEAKEEAEEEEEVGKKKL